jgi:hypothetical protein
MTSRSQATARVILFFTVTRQPYTVRRALYCLKPAALQTNLCFCNPSLDVPLVHK